MGGLSHGRTRDVVSVCLVVVCRAPLPASKVACKHVTRVRPRTRHGEQPCRAPLPVSQVQGGQQPPDPGQAWSPRVVSKPGPAHRPSLHCTAAEWAGTRQVRLQGSAVQAQHATARRDPARTRLTRAPKRVYAVYYNKATGQRQNSLRPDIHVVVGRVGGRGDYNHIFKQ